jgi:hypothetical protein
MCRWPLAIYELHAFIRTKQSITYPARHISLLEYKHFLTTLYRDQLFFPGLFSSSIGGKERSLATYKSRDGGERGSSTAVKDIGRDCEEGAEALHHHATTEEGTREGGHRWLSQLTTGPSNLMDGDHKLRAANKIHVPRCHSVLVTSMQRTHRRPLSCARWSDELNGVPHIAARAHRRASNPLCDMVPSTVAWCHRLSRHASGENGGRERGICG